MEVFVLQNNMDQQEDRMTSFNFYKQKDSNSSKLVFNISRTPRSKPVQTIATPWLAKYVRELHDRDK